MKSVLIDSNVLIRFFVDTKSPFGLEARTLFKAIEQEQILVVLSILVIQEAMWILEQYYKWKKKDIIPVIIKTIALKNVDIFEGSKNKIVDALQLSLEKNVDFTDAYLFINSSINEIFSFDKDFKKM